MTIGEKIREARSAAGLSQSDLASALDIESYQQISAYERGSRTPSAKRLSQIAVILGVPISYFLGDPSNDSIVDQIKTEMLKQGRNMHEVAAAAGVSYNTLYSICSRQSDGSSYSTIRKICLALNMSLAQDLAEGELPEFDALPDGSVGTRIKSVREAQGLTQEQLGALAGGIAGSTIRSYEAGRLNPKIETLQRLADALGAPISALKEFGNQQAPENYTIWKNNWPIGEISLFPWQAKQANKQNRGIYFAPKKEQEEE